MKGKKLVVVGRAYLDNAFRPIYEIREIKRGAKKGQLECLYRASATIFRKKIVPAEFVRLFHNKEDDK